MIKVKRSQSEIVGMLMIVVIISFLLLFVFKEILSDDSGTGNSERENEASAMINGVLRTSSKCTPDTDFRALIIDCTKIDVGTPSEIICSDGGNTCDFAEAKISDILSKTLGERNIPYEYIVSNPSGGEVFKITSVSTEDMDAVMNGLSSVQVATQPLPIGFGYGTLEIKLCLGGTC